MVCGVRMKVIRECNIDVVWVVGMVGDGGHCLCCGKDDEDTRPNLGTPSTRHWENYYM